MKFFNHRYLFLIPGILIIFGLQTATLETLNAQDQNKSKAVFYVQ